MNIIIWKYIWNNWNEYEFEIEDWVLTTENMWDEFNSFITLLKTI